MEKSTKDPACLQLQPVPLAYLFSKERECTAMLNNENKISSLVPLSKLVSEMKFSMQDIGWFIDVCDGLS
jgi:hypothetical protein